MQYVQRKLHLSVTDTRTDLISRPHESTQRFHGIELSPRIWRRIAPVPALLALILVTAVWGVTFVQVKDAVALYPLFAFLAVRFAIASADAGRSRRRSAMRRLGRGGVRRRGVPRPAARRRVRAADGRARADDGVEHGLHHRDVRRADAADRPRALSRRASGSQAWGGVVVATGGLAMLSGIHAGSVTGDLLVLAAAAVYSLQIVLMERYAPRFDALGFHLRRDGGRVSRAARRRARTRRSRRAAWLDGLGRAARDGRVRECARISRRRPGPSGAPRRPAPRWRSRWSRSGRRSSVTPSRATGSVRSAGEAAP